MTSARVKSVALRDVVRDHMHDTMAYVFASAGPAKKIQEDLTSKAFPVKKAAGRRTLAVDGDTLPAELPNSWLIIVLVHEDHDVEVLAKWSRGKDLSRIHLFFPPGVDLYVRMKPWAQADLPSPGHVGHYRSLPAFRRDVGVVINYRIGRDFG